MPVISGSGGGVDLSLVTEVAKTAAAGAVGTALLPLANAVSELAATNTQLKSTVDDFNLTVSGQGTQLDNHAQQLASILARLEELGVHLDKIPPAFTGLPFISEGEPGIPHFNGSAYISEDAPGIPRFSGIPEIINVTA